MNLSSRMLLPLVFLSFLSNICTNSFAQDSEHRTQLMRTRQAQLRQQAAPFASQTAIAPPAQPKTNSFTHGSVKTASGRDFALAINSGGIERRMRVHIPLNYTGKQSLPVVLIFHGFGLNSRIMQSMTNFDKEADRNGFIAVYPDALNRRWTDSPSESKSDDVKFVIDMINYLSRNFAVDQRRIYACGISNGGYFAERLACEVPDRIAAVGVVVASALESVITRAHAKPVPIMFFFGGDDPLVPRENQARQLGKLGETFGVSSLDTGIGKVAEILTIQEAVGFWIKHNGCANAKRSEQLPDLNPRDGCRVRSDSYGSGRSSVIVYTIEGAGHTWPGGNPYATGDIFGRITQDIRATALLWDFFRRQSL